MNRPTILGRFAPAFVVSIALIGLVTLASPASSGGAPSGYTGAPGESTCNSCHAGTLNSGTAAFSIAAPVSFAPGGTHAVTVSLQNSTMPKHGFEIVAKDGSGNSSGSWQIVQTGMTKNASGSTFHHEQTSTGANQSSWTMNWIGPASLPNGPVSLYACGLEGNGSGSSGDKTYTKSRKIYQASLSTPTTIWVMNVARTVTLSAPNHGGEVYFIVPSEDPTPVSFGGPFVFEVNPFTGLLDLAFQLPTVFQNITGNLNAAGQATATVTIPFVPQLVGFNLHFAGITATPTLTPTEVSNRVTVTLQ